MRSIRPYRGAALAVIGVLSLAWLVGSNHCALAAIEGAHRSGHSCCQKSDTTSAPIGMQCCDAFHVPLPQQAAVPTASLHVAGPAWLEADPVLPPEPPPLCLARPVHDPPRALSFAERVLQRGLCAHAPPVGVA